MVKWSIVGNFLKCINQSFRFQGILRSHSFSSPILVGTKITQSRPVNNDREFKRTVYLGLPVIYLSDRPDLFKRL